MKRIKKDSFSTQNNKTNKRNPSQTEINELLENYQKGKYDETENLANQLRGKYPNYQFIWKVLGAVFKQTGRLQDSLSANQRAVELSPNDVEAHCNLGLTLQELGRLTEAEIRYRKAIKINKDIAEIHYNLGITLQILEKIEDAIESYVVAIKINPKYAAAHFNLGIALQKIGKLEDAVKSYKKAIIIKPDYSEAYNNLGLTLKELGRLEDARDSYNKAIIFNPDYAEALSNLGLILHKLGRLEDARKRYIQAIKIDPDLAEAYNNLGNTLKDLGRLEDAEVSYNKAIAIKQEYSEAHSNLGHTQQELGKLEDARVSYGKAIAIKPENAEAYSNLGLLLMQVGDLEGSRNLFEKAIKNDNKTWSIYYNYSAYLYKIGDIDSSISYLNRAKFFAPQHKYKLIDLCIKILSTLKINSKERDSNSYQKIKKQVIGLRTDPLILNIKVRNELINYLYKMNTRILDKTVDARYGNGKCSIDFDLFNDNSQIIKVIKQDLTEICQNAVDSEIYIYDSFFNIYGAGSGTKIHNHISSQDKYFDLDKRKYSLVYYLSVGDQSGLEPGILSLFNPDQSIMPCDGMVVIIDANKKHHALYDGKSDRIMIGVNFYSV